MRPIHSETITHHATANNCCRQDPHLHSWVSAFACSTQFLVATLLRHEPKECSTPSSRTQRVQRSVVTNPKSAVLCRHEPKECSALSSRAQRVQSSVVTNPVSAALCRHEPSECSAPVQRRTLGISRQTGRQQLSYVRSCRTFSPFCQQLSSDYV